MRLRIKASVQTGEEKKVHESMQQKYISSVAWNEMGSTVLPWKLYVVEESK